MAFLVLVSSKLHCSHCRITDNGWELIEHGLGQIWRRYSEFEQLRNYLSTTYPWAVIPPLPEKKHTYPVHGLGTDTVDPDFIDRRRAGLEGALHNLLRIRSRAALKVYNIHKLNGSYGKLFSEWSAIEKQMGDGLQEHHSNGNWPDDRVCEDENCRKGESRSRQVRSIQPPSWCCGDGGEAGAKDSPAR
ncbi:unnamed protein product [Nesidiocoris tenuis]|uniref:PX domain-containing protein n=1 Tax=Nesidiocoris tenuis TaxID=355587 RepID=A0A6H5GUY2_9HEMI|nr:unnamed protein product [Nesidiocoris tenuis]